MGQKGDQLRNAGDTLRLRGSDTTYNTADVTVQGRKREPGESRFGVRIAVKNVRTQYNKYMDWQDGIVNCVKLFDTHGRRLRPVMSSVLVDPGGQGIFIIHLDLGESMRGWVYFKMKPGQKAKVFQFKVNGRMGYDTGKWSLL